MHLHLTGFMIVQTCIILPIAINPGTGHTQPRKKRNETYWVYIHIDSRRTKGDFLLTCSDSYRVLMFSINSPTTPIKYCFISERNILELYAAEVSSALYTNPT
ncbi:hypothetical protein P167DRAFT_341814 [Morchella conica CCBAS932]|uniref:Plastocyanin-like domain-containing protein n=1 Tax=Morchella conica CCBAS932 TaxID=1392247 RepID=A0A3N4KRZ2_9PEZI|nr:hypothetical protein P167DRAFT_341814 [Morchella conica CCBAS932]